MLESVPGETDPLQQLKTIQEELWTLAMDEPQQLEAKGYRVGISLSAHFKQLELTMPGRVARDYEVITLRQIGEADENQSLEFLRQRPSLEHEGMGSVLRYVSRLEMSPSGTYLIHDETIGRPTDDGLGIEATAPKEARIGVAQASEVQQFCDELSNVLRPPTHRPSVVRLVLGRIGIGPSPNDAQA
jgi:hypothetical protein